MNREVHVRFWESPEVKVLRALVNCVESGMSVTCLLTPRLHPSSPAAWAFARGMKHVPNDNRITI